MGAQGASPAFRGGPGRYPGFPKTHNDLPRTPQDSPNPRKGPEGSPLTPRTPSSYFQNICSRFIEVYRLSNLKITPEALPRLPNDPPRIPSPPQGAKRPPDTLPWPRHILKPKGAIVERPVSFVCNLKGLFDPSAVLLLSRGYLFAQTYEVPPLHIYL